MFNIDFFYTYGHVRGVLDGVCGITIIAKEVDLTIWVQILNEVICISDSINTLRKYMNPTILPPPSVGKLLDRQGFLTLV